MNLDRIRAETRGTQEVIHLNNAGASLMAYPIKKVIQEYQDYEEMHGGYEAARRYRKQLSQTYKVTADFIQAEPQEIAFFESATVAWGAVFYSLPFAPGDIILTSEVEYASNFIPYLQAQKRQGIKIEVIPSDADGLVDIPALRKLATDQVRLISITHMPTNSGLVNPIEEIGQVAKEHGILFLVDACQSFGQYPLDVNSIHCDFLTATGRKYLRGPRGTGFLYIKKDRIMEIEPWLLDLHGATWKNAGEYEIRQDATRFETWESNLANQMGFKAAVEYAQAVGIKNIWERVRALSGELRANLQGVAGITLHDPGKTKSGIVTFGVKNMKPSTLQLKLEKEGINVSVVAPQNTQLDSLHHGLEDMIRASVHYYNTSEEITKFTNLLPRLING